MTYNLFATLDHVYIVKVESGNYLYGTISTDPGSQHCGRGGSTSVRHVLSISGPDSPPLWGGEIGFVRGDLQEAGGGICRFPKDDNGAEGSAT